MSHSCARSASVNEANCRLLKLRAALRADRSAHVQPHSQSTVPTSADCALPAHLGWGVAQLRIQAPNTLAESPKQPFIQPITEPPPQPPLPTSVRVYPSLLTAMLRHERAATGRIWLLSRALDTSGRGWIEVEQLRSQLTSKSSAWRIIGWRRLRQLLQQGRGMFWERDGFGRIWLYGTARVAENLNVARLQGNAVKLPIDKLLNGIQNTKAAFYAAFHAGRKTANPISRATLRELTGSSETTQRTYEASSNMTATANYCISGIQHTPENVRAEAYRRPVVFAVTDHKTGQQHIAWPLPNNYQTTLQTACRGRQRKINRQLKSSSDLVLQGRGGTGGDFGRIFCANGKQATQRSTQPDQYWRDQSSQWRLIS